MLRTRRPKDGAASSEPSGTQEIDAETGLLAAARFEEALAKEISRGQRYGSRSALALFDIAIAENIEAGTVASPARYIAGQLRAAARTSDFVARVSPASFAVLLVEADRDGAELFAERVRTAIGSHPYARHSDGSALYARAWAGVATWEPAIESPQAYARAARSSLMASFSQYESARRRFRGEGINRPTVG